MLQEHKQLSILVCIVFIGFVGTSIAYPLFPPLFLHPTADGIVPIAWPDYTKRILLGVALAAFPLGQFIGAPILGGCSDRYGRKLLLLISLAGSVIGYLLSAVAVESRLLWLLLISRFFTGMMEGNIAIAQAMATELNPISKLKSFGQIKGAAALGYVMGPLIGGFLSDPHFGQGFSFALPFWAAAFFFLSTLLFAIVMLAEKKANSYKSELSFLQRLNLLARFRFLFKQSLILKRLLIISTLFTLAVDTFYEFGPVYLTGLWSLSPAGIAIYNAILCLTLVIGNAWLPYFLSHYFSSKKAITVALGASSLIFGLMVLFPSRVFAFLLFGLSGLSIGMANTHLTTQLSHSAPPSLQGEAMGAQMSLRMLGAGSICLVGGFLIVPSFLLPIAISSLIAMLTGGWYALFFWKKPIQNS